MKISKHKKFQTAHLNAEDIQNLSFISNIAIFQNASQELLERIYMMCKPQEFIRHHIIYRECDSDLSFYLIKSGEIEVHPPYFYYFKISQIINFNCKSSRIQVRLYFLLFQIALLSEGEYFGEKEHLLRISKRTTLATTFSETALLFRIIEKDFLSIISNRKIQKQLITVSEMKEKWRQDYSKAVIKIKKMQHYQEQPKSLQQTPRQKIEFVKLSQTMRSADREIIEGPLGEILKQTINLKNVSDFYKKFSKLPSKDQSVYWIMDRETFIRGIDRIDYRVYPPSFNIKTKCSTISPEKRIQDSQLHSEEAAQIEKKQLFNSFFQESQSSLDKDELQGINRMKIRQYIYKTNKKFGLQFKFRNLKIIFSRKRSISLLNRIELPTLEINMKNNYSKLAKNQVITSFLTIKTKIAFDSVNDILGQIEKKRQNTRVTGFFYQFQGRKSRKTVDS